MNLSYQNLSYQEKSAWGSLIITLLAFGYYFVAAVGMWREGSAGAGALTALIIAVVVAVVVAEIAYQILIALMPGSDLTDERDRLIEGKAIKVAYFLLAAGAIIAMGHAIASWGAAESGWTSSAEGAMSPFVTIHILLFAFIAAEVAKFCMQLYHFRAGV